MWKVYQCETLSFQHLFILFPWFSEMLKKLFHEHACSVENCGKRGKLTFPLNGLVETHFKRCLSRTFFIFLNWFLTCKDAYMTFYYNVMNRYFIIFYHIYII